MSGIEFIDEMERISGIEGNNHALAKWLEVDRAQIISWRRGGRPTRQTLARICARKGWTRRDLDRLWNLVQSISHIELGDLDEAFRSAPAFDPERAERLITRIESMGWDEPIKRLWFLCRPHHEYDLELVTEFLKKIDADFDEVWGWAHDTPGISVKRFKKIVGGLDIDKKLREWVYDGDGPVPLGFYSNSSGGSG